jgi:hypothetical protein
MSFLKELVKSEASVKQFEKEYYQHIGKKQLDNKPFPFGIIKEKKL